jgi:hypothetical protein
MDIKDYYYYYYFRRHMGGITTLEDLNQTFQNE